jgi:hypothetical protein
MDNDEKAANFKRLAERRLRELLDVYLRRLVNLSNPYSYSYSRSQVDYIFDKINEAVADARGRFDEGMRKQEARQARNGHGEVEDGEVSRLGGGIAIPD